MHVMAMKYEMRTKEPVVNGIRFNGWKGVSCGSDQFRDLIKP